VYASQIAFHNAINRYAFALSRDGVLPRWVGTVHPRFGSPYRAGLLQTALAVVVIAVFALAGADPYSDLLLWVNTPGVVGVLVLQTMTAAATVAYFLRRNRAAATPVAIGAGVASAVLLAAATLLLVDHIELLTAASTTVNVLLVGIVPLTLAIGTACALWLRARHPERYAGIGEGADADATPTPDLLPTTDDR
jgi:amino acid transporter